MKHSHRIETESANFVFRIQGGFRSEVLCIFKNTIKRLGISILAFCAIILLALAQGMKDDSIVPLHHPYIFGIKYTPIACIAALLLTPKLAH